jgi:alkyl hydroperoxide reductase subunit AhpF
MTDVVVLSSPACHLCEDALEALAQLARELPIRVREVGMETPEGRELVRIHRPAMPPAVFVDGALFSAGRLPQKKLRRFLERAA